MQTTYFRKGQTATASTLESIFLKMSLLCLIGTKSKATKKICLATTFLEWILQGGVKDEAGFC